MATMLITSIMTNDVQEVRQLLEQGAGVDTPDDKGYPPLHVAAGSGHYEIAELLLVHGPDPNSKNVQGGTALHLAAAGYPKIVALLLKKGANAKTPGPNGVTALHVAVQQKQPETVKLLAENGADLDGRITAGQTALQMAQEDRQDEIARILGAAGAHR